MNLARLLVRSARAFPDRPAVFVGETLLHDYRTLARRAAAIAGQLRRSAGLATGDRVALFLANTPEYLELLYAIWWAGLVAVPVNAKLHPRELAWILDNADASVLFVDADQRETVQAAIQTQPTLRAVIAPGSAEYDALIDSPPWPIEQRAPDDLAWLFYTSGTTGRPKGVMLTHRNLLAMTLSYFADVDEVSAADTTIYAAPFSHGAGLYNFMFVMQAARHVMPASRGFEPAELIALASFHKRACLFAAPTMVKRLVDHVAASGADCSGLKTIVYGGGPMYVEDIRRALDVMGNRLVQIYGQGESPMTITALSRAQIADREHPRWLPRIASVGVAHSVVEVRIADANGSDAPIGEIGEVLVRSDTVMAGYWRNAEATANTIRDGWLWTGDMGALDEHGFLTLKDRSKDVIISGGSNIYPREVEEALLMHPGVRDVAVVGRRDPEWGEVVVAFVVAPGVDETALDALCLQHIGRFKRPRIYRFVDSLPRNNTGKVLKTALRETLAGDAA